MFERVNFLKVHSVVVWLNFLKNFLKSCEPLKFRISEMEFPLKFNRIQTRLQQDVLQDSKGYRIVQSCLGSPWHPYPMVYSGQKKIQLKPLPSNILAGILK